jgi:hypothetical protein
MTKGFKHFQKHVVETSTLRTVRLATVTYSGSIDEQTAANIRIISHKPDFAARVFHGLFPRFIGFARQSRGFFTVSLSSHILKA